MSRRSNGEGTVVQLPDGTFRARFRYVDDYGKAYRPEFKAKTRAEALRKMRAAQDRIAAGQSLRDAKTTVGAWLEEWIVTGLENSDRRRGSKDIYASLLRNHAVPTIGHHQIGLLRASQVETMLADKVRSGAIGGNTARVLYAALSAAMNTAVRDNLVTENVVAKVARPAGGGKRKGFLSQTQAHTLVTALADDPLLLDLVKVMLLTGLRRGEALALTWTAISERRLDVAASLSRASDGLHMRETKSAAGERYLPVSGPLGEVLTRRRRAQAELRLSAPVGTWEDHDLVFSTALGKPLEPSNMGRRFKLAAEEAGLPTEAKDPYKVTLHTLRHSAASFLLAAGVPMKVVQEILGHSNYSTTADTYTHVAPELATDAMGKLGEALGW